MISIPDNGQNPPVSAIFRATRGPKFEKKWPKIVPFLKIMFYITLRHGNITGWWDYFGKIPTTRISHTRCSYKAVILLLYYRQEQPWKQMTTIYHVYPKPLVSRHCSHWIKGVSWLKWRVWYRTPSRLAIARLVCCLLKLLLFIVNCNWMDENWGWD